MDDALALRVSHLGPVGCGSMPFDVALIYPGGSDAARDSFPDLLRAGLAAAGVSVCGPDESQAAGSSSQPPDAFIRWSKICIPILSEDFASSEWCLRGLVQMMKGKLSGQQKVLPILDRVRYCQVRYLTGSFEKARQSDIQGLKEALDEVSFLQGWKMADWREEELVEIVVLTVLACLRPDILRSPHIVQYNVFLNFRGTDTRKGITRELYTILRGAGVSVFKDDTDIPIGEDFRSELLSAITQSTIYITVLSPNYASSKWCLYELKKMMECMESMGHTVLPIFYRVDPTEVRRPRKKFQEALLKHEMRRGGRDATEEARKALHQVANLKGWAFHSEPPTELIRKRVVQKVLRSLRHHFQLDVPEHLLRIDDRGKQISRL